MLSPADRALTERDQAIPGLATVLDSEAVAALLRRFRPEVKASELTGTYVRYKPGTNCLVGYNAQLGGAAVPLLIEAHRLSANEKLWKSREKPGTAGPLGPGTLVIENLGLVIRTFPNDPKLPGLKSLASDRQHKLLRELVDRRKSLRGGTLKPISYRPGRRYVAVLEMPTGPAALVKLHAPEDFERAQRNSAAFRSKGTLRIPKLLGCSHSYHAVASLWISGEPFQWTEEAAVRTGTALAELHRQTGAGASLFGRDRPSHDLRRLAQDLAFLCPALEARIHRLSDRVGTALANAAGPLCPLHGDFYGDQILLLPDRVAFLDFDEATCGPAARDLGNFRAHAIYRSLDKEAEAPNRQTVLDSMFASYAASGAEVEDRQLNAETAFGLLKLAPHCFRSIRSDWPDRMEMLIGRAEALLEAPLLTPTSSGRTDPQLPLVSPAVQARTLSMRRPNGQCEDWRVMRSELVRYKAGKRCVIEYDAVAADGALWPLIAKMRTGAADRRTYKLQQELWNDGFGCGAEDGIEVPEPVGIIPKLSMWAQKKLVGRTLTELFMEGTPPAPAFAAAALVKFHNKVPLPQREYRAEDELRILIERFDHLCRKRPDLRPRADVLQEESRRLISRLQPANVCGIHRDFYPDHLLFDGGKVALLDLDLVTRGDPAVDVGNFLAHVTELSLRAFGDPEQLTSWAEDFRAAYIERNPRCCERNILVYEYLSLARLVDISTRIHDRRRLTCQMIQLCEGLLEKDLTPAGGLCQVNDRRTRQG